MRPVPEDLTLMVLGFFGGDRAKAVLWFSLPNPGLGGVSPADLLALGREEAVRRFVSESLRENRPSFGLEEREGEMGIVDAEREPPRRPTFEKELEHLINRYSKENGSDTPDFILAEYLQGCLANFDATLRKREAWYGRGPRECDPPDGG